MVMARVSATACGYEDANDLDRPPHDPLRISGRAVQDGGWDALAPRLLQRSDATIRQNRSNDH
jgi:hypothetical protein